MGMSRSPLQGQPECFGISSRVLGQNPVRRRRLDVAAFRVPKWCIVTNQKEMSLRMGLRRVLLVHPGVAPGLPGLVEAHGALGTAVNSKRKKSNERLY